jgi:hypothetical protein
MLCSYAFFIVFKTKKKKETLVNLFINSILSQFRRKHRETGKNMLFFVSLLKKTVTCTFAFKLPGKKVDGHVMHNFKNNY